MFGCALATIQCLGNSCVPEGAFQVQFCIKSKLGIRSTIYALCIVRSILYMYTRTVHTAQNHNQILKNIKLRFALFLELFVIFILSSESVDCILRTGPLTKAHSCGDYGQIVGQHNT